MVPGSAACFKLRCALRAWYRLAVVRIPTAARRRRVRRDSFLEEIRAEAGHALEVAARTGRRAGFEGPVSDEIWLWWSSGKDSAWALRALEAAGEGCVTRLVTTVTGEGERVAVHGVPAELLAAQARSVGRALRTVPLPQPCSNRDYERATAAVLDEAEAAGVRGMAFGDLFLADIRAYRTDLLADRPIAPLFPIWGRDTRALAHTMLDAGLDAVVTCVDTRALPAELAGARFDRDFLQALPAGVDPCGENGEFHTFCVDGPMFANPICVELAGVETREGFAFAELMPAQQASA
jgi:uncharacterized protein (TIGR00290 family)